MSAAANTGLSSHHGRSRHLYQTKQPLLDTRVRMAEKCAFRLRGLNVTVMVVVLKFNIHKNVY